MLRAYLGVLRKEFLQVRRDPIMLRLIFIMPILQLVLLGYAVNLDVKRIAVDVYDYDQTEQSRRFVQAMQPNDYFIPTAMTGSEDVRPTWHVPERFRTGDADMALILPENFSEELALGGNVTIGLVADASDANQASIGTGYAGQIVRQFNERELGIVPPLDISVKALYNPEGESVYYMVPGIVATLLTMITVMLTAMAIVRERETGTLEQVLVTPINATVLLLGKITTFAILGFIEIVIALTVGVLWFGVPFVGSPVLLFALAALYLFTTLGIGMLFSTMTSTQQQAMFLAWFFTVFAILTSGFFTPIDNMPEWLQAITVVNPMRWFMEIVRAIMMKGAGISDVLHAVYPLVIIGISVFSLALARFSKRVA